MNWFSRIKVKRWWLGTTIPGPIEVTATGAELNLHDGLTATTSDLNKFDGVTATSAEVKQKCDVSDRGVKPTAGTTALTLTAALHAGKIIYVIPAAGSIAITLPEATGTFDKYKIMLGTNVTSGQAVSVECPSANAKFHGQAMLGECDGGNSVAMFAAIANSNTVRLNGSSFGGLKGGIIEIQDIAANMFVVNVRSGDATDQQLTPWAAT
jgi:hypothetical protein